MLFRSGVWYSERYIGSDVAAWTTATNWERVPMTADFQAFLPAVPFSNRVLADGGSVRNKQALFDSYKTALDLLPNTVLAFSPEIGVKQSVNGLVYKASKLYDMSPVSNDANQATAANQPYIGGNVAPNERMWLWGLSKTMAFTPIAFNATDKWSVSIVADIVGSSADFIGSLNTRIAFNNAATDSITFKNESATSENFFRTNPSLNYLQEDIATGDGGSAYTGTLTQTPIMPGFKPNPPGAYSDSTVSGNDIEAQYLNWNVLITAEGDADATSGIPVWYSLVDDGQGNLFAPTQTTTNPSSAAGSVNYITGAVSITSFLDSSNNPVTITSGNTINAQYVPYVASRPQSVVFFQDQMYFYPVPDQAYTVSFEAYRYPFAFSASDVSAPTTAEPQLREWWQLLAYGAADKIFADNADFESMAKFRPLLEEQMKLALRRSIVQQTSERTATIYTEQSQFPQYPFGNLFSGF